MGEESIVLPLPGEKEVDEKLESRGDASVDLALRPQNVKYSFEPKDGYFFKAVVYSYESIGNKSVIEAECGEYQLLVLILPNGLKVEIDQEIYLYSGSGTFSFL